MIVCLNVSLPHDPIPFPLNFDHHSQVGAMFTTLAPPSVHLPIGQRGNFSHGPVGRPHPPPPVALSGPPTTTHVVGAFFGPPQQGPFQAHSHPNGVSMQQLNVPPFQGGPPHQTQGPPLAMFSADHMARPMAQPFPAMGHQPPFVHSPQAAQLGQSPYVGSHPQLSHPSHWGHQTHPHWPPQPQFAAPQQIGPQARISLQPPLGHPQAQPHTHVSIPTQLGQPPSGPHPQARHQPQPGPQHHVSGGLVDGTLPPPFVPPFGFCVHGPQSIHDHMECIRASVSFVPHNFLAPRQATYAPPQGQFQNFPGQSGTLQHTIQLHFHQYQLQRMHRQHLHQQQLLQQHQQRQQQQQQQHQHHNLLRPFPIQSTLHRQQLFELHQLLLTQLPPNLPPPNPNCSLLIVNSRPITHGIEEFISTWRGLGLPDFPELTEPHLSVARAASDVIVTAAAEAGITARYTQEHLRWIFPHPSFLYQVLATLSNMQSEEAPAESDYETLLSIAETLGEVKPRGMSKYAIDQLPTFDFPGDSYEGDQRTCVVCLCDFELGEVIRVLSCSHKFHSECIDKWLRTNRTCPICRADTASFLEDVCG